MINTKYEKTIMEFTTYANDISLYPQKLSNGKLTYGGNKTGEDKQLPIKMRLIKTGGDLKQRDYQLVVELCGDYHIENIIKPNIPIDNWYSYGKIWFSATTLKDLIERLKYFLEEIENENQNLI